MALVLAFNVTERGDNKLLTITDNTGTGTTGWGGSGNPILTDITAMHLDIDITTSNNIVESYDRITLDGPISTASEIVFNISCADLMKSGIPLGTNDDILPDGLWAITYTYNSTATHTDSTVLVDGAVKTAIYELQRLIPTKYLCEYNHEREVLDILFTKAYYDAMVATALVGRESDVINQLYTLERLVTNGSKYTW